MSDERKPKYLFVKKEWHQKDHANEERNKAYLEELNWMKRQAEYLSFSMDNMTRYDLKRGEIYEFDWGINVNSEFSHRHFGVILADSKPENPLVLVCPLKTKKGPAHAYSDVDLGRIEGLGNDGAETLAVVNQVRGIDKLRIYTVNAIGKTRVPAEGKVLSESDMVGPEAYIPKLCEEKIRLIIEKLCLILSKASNSGE